MRMIEIIIDKFYVILFQYSDHLTAFQPNAKCFPVTQDSFKNT